MAKALPMTQQQTQGEAESFYRSCERCGEPTFFNHAMSRTTGDGWEHTHGWNAQACEHAAKVRAAMTVLYDMAIQSLVEIGDILGELLCNGSEEEWNDPAALHRALLDAYHLAGEGIRTEKRWREASP